MPEIPSITSMLSGKGLTHSLAEIKQFIAEVSSLNLNIQTVATKFSRKGLPSSQELLAFKAAL